MAPSSSLFPLLLPERDRVRWDDLQAFDWVRALASCPQDPIHHAEGDVWIHTRMISAGSPGSNCCSEKMSTDTKNRVGISCSRRLPRRFNMADAVSPTG